MSFPRNTYVVLDIPQPFADEVLETRRRHGDNFRWSLPAEKTICGSNGVGPIMADEDPEHVFATLERIAAATAPITTSFGPTRRFPHSDVFYLSFADDSALRALHGRLASSGIRFSPVPFAFEPHVTLSTRSPVADETAREMLGAQVPGVFTLDTLSVYELPLRAPSDRFETLLCLHYRAQLRGGEPS